MLMTWSPWGHISNVKYIPLSGWSGWLWQKNLWKPVLKSKPQSKSLIDFTWPLELDNWTCHGAEVWKDQCIGQFRLGRHRVELGLADVKNTFKIDGCFWSQTDFQVKYGKHLSSAATKLCPHAFATQKLAVRVANRILSVYDFQLSPLCAFPLKGCPFLVSCPMRKLASYVSPGKVPVWGYTALRYRFGMSLSWNVIVMDIVIIVVVIVIIIIIIISIIMNHLSSSIIKCFRMYIKTTL